MNEHDRHAVGVWMGGKAALISVSHKLWITFTRHGSPSPWMWSKCSLFSFMLSKSPRRFHVEAWLAGSREDRSCTAWPCFLVTTGERGKGIPRVIRGRRGRGGGPVIQRMLPHSTYWLTVNRTGLYLQHQCHHMTTVHQPPPPYCRRGVNTVHTSCSSTG